MMVNKNYLYSVLITCQQCGSNIVVFSNLELEIFKKRLKQITTPQFLEKAKCKELYTNSINHSGLLISIKDHLGNDYRMSDFDDAPNMDTITT